jgi:intein/homing endonuclease
VWAYQLDQRRALAAPLGLDPDTADELSRWVLAHPARFEAADLRCWRIGSRTWISLAREQLEPVGDVERPVGVFVLPAIAGSDGWQLTPVLALDTIRLVAELGGRLERDLRSAVIPIASREELLERINVHTLHAGPRECLDSAGQLAQELTRQLHVPINPGVPSDKRDRWGRLAVHRRSYENASGTKTTELELRVLTFPTRGFGQRRLGSAPRDEQYGHPSAVMDLGEAVQTAVDAGVPLLLSTEAAGELTDTVRVGRMKGRPGMLTITTADGVSASTRRVVAEQALGELRSLKRTRANVTLSAGARQLVRMAVARPLADDSVLLGRQREMAALKVVGSGVDASAVGTGKCCGPHTKVLANGTLTEIEELWRRYRSGSTFDGEGEWTRPSEPLVTNSLGGGGAMVSARVTALYRQRVCEPGRRVTLDDGSTIEITNAHRLLGTEGWTSDVAIGDFVCVPRVLRHDGEALAYDLVELVAWQLAEGYELSGTPGRKGYTDRVTITQKDVAVLERLRRLARSIGERHGIRMGTLAIRERPGRAAALTIASVAYRRLLANELGYAWGYRSASKRTPDAIMAAEDLTVVVFLRAFFDAEGSVGGRNRRVVEITSASQHLIEQLSTLLRRFGVWLRVACKEKCATNGSRIKRTYWTGYIAGPSLRRYAEQIGFGDERKRGRLFEACAAPTNTNVEGVPVTDIIAMAKTAGCNYGLAQPADGVTGRTVGRDRGLRMAHEYRRTIAVTGDPARQRALDPRVRKAVQRVDAGALDVVAHRLEERLVREVFYAKVVRVEEIELDGWVYDVEVADYHNFVAGGILAQNTISSGRALAHRASTQPRFRGLVIAEGRLLGQWREELSRGDPGRGLPPIAPNVELLVLCDDRQIAGQIRRFDRELGDRPGVMLAPNSVLDRFPADLQAIPWHLLIADEALRYANPATEAHQALAQVRFGSVADCWLLTATPRGKSAEHLDVLVGLAVGDEAMITERLNTREAGDLMDEINAHRLRVNYGPHLVRVTRADMQASMPEVRPAQPLALDPDPALAGLLDAIRQGGREAYRRLLEVLRELRSLEAGSELYKRALAELARAQGVVLGNVGVFVDASVDPETLTHSKAALASALTRQGLVAEAGRGGGDGLPLLRGVTAQTLAGVAGEEQVIVFGEPGVVSASARRHAARPARRRGACRRRQHQHRRVRGAQTAVHGRRVPSPVPVANRT